MQLALHDAPPHALGAALEERRRRQLGLLHRNANRLPLGPATLASEDVASRLGAGHWGWWRWWVWPWPQSALGYWPIVGGGGGGRGVRRLLALLLQNRKQRFAS
ncbi:hypothetical protein TYRP_008802 [Tyrophagus putrescentiae]|nr:hypothetical protein TYRP_008802 [Tyrophagus putrescentiae]